MTFNFENLRLPATFETGITAKKLVTTVPVKKPRSGLDFFRIRPDSEWTFDTFLLDLKEGEEEKYLVIPELLADVASTGKLKPVTIFAGITFNGSVFSSRISHFPTKMEKITSTTGLVDLLMKWRKRNGSRYRRIRHWEPMR